MKMETVRPSLIIVIFSFLALVSGDHQKVPVFRLNNNYEMPAIGIGTYQLEDAESVAKDAIDVGFRHFDTAFPYGNERELGKGINAKIDEGVIKREDVWITSKIWSTFHRPELLFKQLHRTLEKLNTSYLDLLLIHYPISYGRRHKDGSDKVPYDVDDFNPYPTYENGSTVYDDVDPKDTWQAMERLVDAGLVRSIGISNFNKRQVEYILSIARIKPVLNQVEIHPNFSQIKMRQFLKSKNMEAAAFSPLGKPRLINDTTMAFRHPTVKKLALKYQRSPAQIILRFMHQINVVIVTNAVLKNHLIENINIFDFNLDEEDMKIMHSFHDNHRLTLFIHDVDHKDYPYKDEY